MGLSHSILQPVGPLPWNTSGVHFREVTWRRGIGSAHPSCKGLTTLSEEQNTMFQYGESRLSGSFYEDKSSTPVLVRMGSCTLKSVTQRNLTTAGWGFRSDRFSPICCPLLLHPFAQFFVTATPSPRILSHSVPPLPLAPFPPRHPPRNSHHHSISPPSPRFSQSYPFPSPFSSPS